ncbi:uncharacterized protein [Solanum lycopersicum]|uniref:uncharacterized protein n=1 Tax=Solanum lycopersicum TaxID=4081 RepID=UPI00374A08DA
MNEQIAKKIISSAKRVNDPFINQNKRVFANGCWLCLLRRWGLVADVAAAACVGAVAHHLRERQRGERDGGRREGERGRQWLVRGKKGRRRWERGGREEKGRRKREKKRGWRLFEGGDYRRREWRKWGGCWREGRKRRRKMEEREKGGWRGEERSDGREKKRGRATGERGAPGSCCFRRLLGEEEGAERERERERRGGLERGGGRE